MEEFRAIYPQDEEFVASTAAARVNGYVGGYGSVEEVEPQVGDLGLSPAAGRRLLEIVSARRK
jgi:peptide-methionine (S)-S-oxide reductase